MGYARVLKDNDGKPSGYECDGEAAFMPEQQSYENIFRRVKIDLDTLEVLNHDFIKDKRHVYRKGILLRGIIPENFHVFNAVYIGNKQVSPYSYGRDEEFVYFFTNSTDTRYAIKLKACQNPKAFSVLFGGYAKDCNNLFYYGNIVNKGD